VKKEMIMEHEAYINSYGVLETVSSPAFAVDPEAEEKAEEGPQPAAAAAALATTAVGMAGAADTGGSLRASTSAVGQASTAAAATAATAAASAAVADSDDDEYSGCFEGAEVIVSQSCAAAEGALKLPVAAGGKGEGVVLAATAMHGYAAMAPAGDGAASAPAARSAAESSAAGAAAVAAAEPASSTVVIAENASSDGSELNSELDDSDFDEGETENVIFAELTKVVRQKRRWTVHLRHGVLQVDGVEILFSAAQGTFDVDVGGWEE